MSNQHVRLDPHRGQRVPEVSEVDHNVEAPAERVTLDLGAHRQKVAQHVQHGERLDIGSYRRDAEERAEKQARWNRGDGAA